MARARVSRNPPSSVSELAALGKVFEDHTERLLAMVRRRIDPALAPRLDPEDILSEAFLRTRLRWPSRDPAMSTYSWRYRITLDCLMDAWRSAHAAGRSLQKQVPWPDRLSIELGLGLVGSFTSSSAAFDRKERHEKITWAVQQLKPDDRDILIMRHSDDLSYQEAAAVLGTTQDVVHRYAGTCSRLKRIWNASNLTIAAYESKAQMGRR